MPYCKKTQSILITTLKSIKMKTLQVTEEIRKTLSLKQLNFSSNLNNKLDCNSFCTVRLKDNVKYQLHDLYEVTLLLKVTEQNVSLGIVRLQVIHNFYLHEVAPAICFLDANLNRIDFQQLFETMSKSKKIDLSKNLLSFMVFQYVMPDEVFTLVDNCR